MDSIILVSGSIAYDRIMNFCGRFKDHIMPDKIHILNLSFEVENLAERCGGTAGNIAYSLGLLDRRCIILGAAGDDFAPYKKRLQNVGVDTSRVQVVENKKTAFVNIITDLDDNQIAAFYPGAMECAQVNDSLPKGASFAIVGPEKVEVMKSWCSLYKKKHIPYIFDPAQQIPRFTKDDILGCLKGAYMLIGNDYEIHLISQKTSLSLEELKKLNKILVITYGEKGSVIFSKGREIQIEAIKPRAFVDPTGAGDSYRAGFVAGLVEEKSLEECGKLASWTAARAIEHYGAQEHVFNRKEFSSARLQI